MPGAYDRTTRVKSRKYILGSTVTALVFGLQGITFAAEIDRIDPERYCLAGAMPDVVKIDTNAQSNSDFRTKLCDKTNSSSNTDQGIDSGGTYLEVISGSESARNNTKKVSVREFCSDKSLVASNSSKTVYYSSILPQAARETFSTCVKAVMSKLSEQPKPLVVTTDLIGDDVNVNVSWNPIFRVAQQRFAEIKSNNLICTPPRDVRRGTLIPTIQPISISCKWVNDFVSTAAVTVTTVTGMGSPAQVDRPITKMGTVALELTHMTMRPGGTQTACTIVNFNYGRNSAKQNVFMTIDAIKPPVASWGSVSERCTDSNGGSCNHNNIDGFRGAYSNAPTIVQQTPTSLRLVRQIEGDPLQFRVCAIETDQEQVPVAEKQTEQDAIRNTNISYIIPSGQSGQLIFTSERSTISRIPVGISAAPFFLTSQTDVPGGRAYTYMIREYLSDSKPASLVTQLR